MVLNAASSLGLCPGEAIALPTPKLSPHDRLQTLYPYYAGFSEAFVEAALDQLDVGVDSRVLDPWNGSGTTTMVASRRGARATGIDLNPVLAEISVARSARRYSVKIAADIYECDTDTASLLLSQEWKEPFKAIYHFESYLKKSLEGLIGQKQASALISIAIYAAIRSLSLSSRSTNPTWFKSKYESLFGPEDFINKFKFHMERIITIQNKESDKILSTPNIMNSDFVDWRGRECSYDAVVTSPPYLTRIDYVKATLPELRYHMIRESIDFVDLRNRMLGTPLTSGLDIAIPETIGRTASKILDLIKLHPSKASSTYYYRFYAQYFVSLALSIAKISKILRVGGGAAIVVQTSHYKEILVDLPTIVAEMGEHHGLQVKSTVSFKQKNSMNYLNTRSYSSITRSSPIESAILFRK